jgi:hypothetical protein
VRREVALRFCEIYLKLKEAVVLGRTGKQLSSHEDDVFSWAAVELGYGFGVFPELKITHLIPARRLTKSYLFQLQRESSYCEGILYYLLTGALPKTGVALLLRVIAAGLKRGFFSMQVSWAVARGQARAAASIARDRHLATLRKSFREQS